MIFGLTYVISPMFILATFHFNKGNLIISPISENYTFILLAYLTLIIGLSILAWRKSKWTTALTSFSVILFGCFMYASTIGYFAIHDDYVIMKTATEEKKYAWSDLDKVKHEYKMGGVASTYFFIKGENVITIDATGQFTYGIQQNIKGLAIKADVPFEEQLIE